MLLRSRIKDLSQLPLVFSKKGINQIVISTLDFIPDKSLASEALLPDDETEYAKLRDLLDKTVDEGKSHGLDIHYNLYNPAKRRRVCTENVQNSLFVSSDGTVSPCVFTNMPITESTLSGNNPSSPYQRMIFGNINEHPLSRTWDQKAYRFFRNSFNTDHPPKICLNCPKLFID
jgi:MoaA/NifB/PqqE/SkfB family radical SAM enzyme